MRAAAVAAVAAVVLLTGCSHPGTSLGKTRDAPPPIEAMTQLIGPSGELRGVATLSQRASGTLVRARIEGLPPGTYAIHLHSVGKCEGPKFTSAGSARKRRVTSRRLAGIGRFLERCDSDVGAQTLNLKCSTSPSRTRYSLPSSRSRPASRAPDSPLYLMKSSYAMVSARMKPRSKSV